MEEDTIQTIIFTYFKLLIQRLWIYFCETLIFDKRKRCQVKIYDGKYRCKNPTSYKYCDIHRSLQPQECEKYHFTKNSDQQDDPAIEALVEYHQRKNYAEKYSIQTDERHENWNKNLYDIFSKEYELYNHYIRDRKKSQNNSAKLKKSSRKRGKNFRDYSYFAFFIMYESIIAIFHVLRYCVVKILNLIAKCTVKDKTTKLKTLHKK